jgi:hypothetical protein
VFDGNEYAQGAGGANKDTLAPGYWTIVKFNVAPAKAEDVGRIIVEPKFSSLRLRN